MDCAGVTGRDRRGDVEPSSKDAYNAVYTLELKTLPVVCSRYARADNMRLSSIVSCDVSESRRYARISAAVTGSLDGSVNILKPAQSIVYTYDTGDSSGLPFTTATIS